MAEGVSLPESGAEVADSLLEVVPLLTGSRDVNAVLQGKELKLFPPSLKWCHDSRC